MNPDDMMPLIFRQVVLIFEAKSKVEAKVQAVGDRLKFRPETREKKLDELADRIVSSLKTTEAMYEQLKIFLMSHSSGPKPPLKLYVACAKMCDEFLSILAATLSNVDDFSKALD